MTFTISPKNKEFQSLMRQIVKAIRNKDSKPYLLEKAKEKAKKVNILGISYNSETDKFRIITPNHQLDFDCKSYE